MKDAVFWGVAQNCSYLLTLVSSLADFATLKMEAIRSSETSVQSTTSTRRHTPEDGILIDISLTVSNVIKMEAVEMLLYTRA
jgi:hypothetical protein